MKKLLIAGIVLLIASPAFAAIQDVKVSGDITTTFLDRYDFGFGDTGGTLLEKVMSAPGIGQPSGVVSQSIVLEQTRVSIDADLTDNVSATVRLLNESAWGLSAGDASSSSNDGLKSVDLDLAYVTLREFLYSPLTLTIGRQEFYFGDGFIIGGGPNNLTTGQLNGIANDLSMMYSQDGVKAVLDYKPLTLTMIYYKNEQNLDSLGGAYGTNSEASSDVYGLNANYQLNDTHNTVVEAYMFSKIDGKNSQQEFPEYDLPNTMTEALLHLPFNQDKNDSIYVPGLRVSTDPIKGLNVQGEFAWQFGTQVVPDLDDLGQAAEPREAMAAHLMAAYSLPVLEKYKPILKASVTYVSGDKNGIDGDTTNPAKSAKVYTAWDPMFEGQDQGTIYKSLFLLSDMYIYSLGVSVEPLQDVTAAFTWSSLWSAESFTNTLGMVEGKSGGNPLCIYQPNSSTPYDYLMPVPKANRNALGNEYDVNFNYAYTEDVSLGLGLGWLVPGSAFSDGYNKIASQAMVDIAVKF